ncbi:nuclear transport factor 2 family protein [Symbioplanes lichenis]|uniref:nuclear transport factor 2 family protein n=1 Tax=Symbioplanes lichenis TaxID=1629072 RepID=UPI0027381A19|nr:nuclear transport factor 2 family protein [Actinoplanes lichenis]
MLSTKTDRDELVELMGRYADIADLKEFTDLPASVFTDTVTLDFSSVVGLPEMTVSLADYIGVLAATFAPFEATHHAITGHVVDIDGDTATVHAHVRAEHWLPVAEGPDRWLVVGFYDNDAVRTPDGWRLSRVRLTAIHQENAHLAAAVPQG